MGVSTRSKKQEVGQKKMGVSTRSKKQEVGDTETRQCAFLKVVHPRGYVELFREPITAGEIMRRYPRHCLARPDFFEFPWIVVHSESVLVPGKVFYLVPHRTIDKLLKEKKQQRESMNPKQDQPPAKQYYNHYQNHNRQQAERCNERETNDRRRTVECSERQRRDSDSGNQYKQSFYRSWQKMSRNLQQPYDQLDSEPDSPLDSGGSCLTLTSGRPCVGSSEKVELLRIKSCLRKADSVRKKLDLRVSFASPLVIPGSQRESPSVQHDHLVSQLQTHVLYKSNSFLI